MAAKNKADRSHKPTGPQHYGDGMRRRINSRAVNGLTMVGIPTEHARRIAKTPLGGAIGATK